MELNKHKDNWTNTTDYWWSEGEKIISPYFLKEEDALKWKQCVQDAMLKFKKENYSDCLDYSCNGTDTDPIL